MKDRSNLLIAVFGILMVLFVISYKLRTMQSQIQENKAHIEKLTELLKQQARYLEKDQLMQTQELELWQLHMKNQHGIEILK